MVEGRRILKVTEAAARLALHRSTVYEHMESGALPYVQIGAAKRIPERALEEFMAARIVAGKEGR
jgi:excisionase family DNA binding protein